MDKEEKVIITVEQMNKMFRPYDYGFTIKEDENGPYLETIVDDDKTVEQARADAAEFLEKYKMFFSASNLDGELQDIEDEK